MKFAQAHGYIVTANSDGSIPLASKIAAKVDGDPKVMQALIDQANAYDDLQERITDMELAAVDAA